MSVERKLKRWQLIKYLSVYESDTGELLGLLVDLTVKGMKLESEKPVPAGEDFYLWMEIVSKRVDLKARSLWCRFDEKTKLYNMGFRLVHLPDETVSSIEGLIAALKFQRMTKEESN